VPANFASLDNGIGPNRKKYSYSYFAIGTFLSSNFNNEQLLETKYSSFHFASGSTQRFRMSRVLGFIFDLDFAYEMFKLKNLDSTNTLNYLPILNKANYNFGKISTDLALQFNFRRKRGNQLGTYLTLGYYVDYSFSKRFVTKFVQENGYTLNGKNTYTKLPFATAFNHGGVIKFGKHFWTIFGKYRISNAFDNGQMELPRLLLGIEILMHDKE